MQFIEQIFLLLKNILGFSPILMIPVFVGVSIVSHLFGVKKNLDKCKDFVLGILCIIFGIGVAYFTGYSSIKIMIKTGLILGSVCALTYQIFVSLFETLQYYIDKKIDKYAGKDIEVKENSLFTQKDNKNDDR